MLIFECKFNENALKNNELGRKTAQTNVKCVSGVASQPVLSCLGQHKSVHRLCLVYRFFLNSEGVTPVAFWKKRVKWLG